MADQPVATFAMTRQTISERVLAECRKTYGSMVDDLIIQSWVTAALNKLLTEQTRVTQFVAVLALRDIRERANQYLSEAA
jgi:hypothetical protein